MPNATPNANWCGPDELLRQHPNYAFIWDEAGFEGTTARIREKQKAGDYAGMAAQISDEHIAVFATESTWDDPAWRACGEVPAGWPRGSCCTTHGRTRREFSAMARWHDNYGVSVPPCRV